MKLDEMYDILIEAGVCEQTIDVVVCLNGRNEKSFKDILWACYGYTDFDEFKRTELGR